MAPNVPMARATGINSPANYRKLNRKPEMSISQQVGGTQERPPPLEIGNIVVEIWCYLPEIYTFGAESEIQEIFSKKL